MNEGLGLMVKNRGALRVDGLQSPVGCKEAVVRRVGFTVECAVCGQRKDWGFMWVSKGCVGEDLESEGLEGCYCGV